MQPIVNISALVGNLLREFLATQDVQHRHSPDQDSHKLNFEVAVFKASNKTGIRVIARCRHLILYLVNKL